MTTQKSKKECLSMTTLSNQTQIRADIKNPRHRNDEGFSLALTFKPTHLSMQSFEASKS
jgi:hypothetical protein